MNLEWIKHHKFAVAGVIFGGFLLLYLVSKRSSSSSGLAGVLATQQQGQLQMAQLNAQLSAQGQQTQAQLEAQQIAVNAQQQQEQDQAAMQIALYALQGHTYESALEAEQNYEASVLPLEQKLVNYPGLQGHQALQQTVLNELALLLTKGQAAGSLPPIQPGQSGGFSIGLPGFSFGFGGL